MTFSSVSRKFMYAMFGTALLFSVACKKDKDGGNGPGPGPGPGPVSKKLVKVETDPQNYLTFEYNADGTFKKITNVSDEGDELTTGAMTFTYNDSKKISEIHNEDGTRIKYVYTNNVVTTAEIYDDENVKVAYNKFTYEGGRVASGTTYTTYEDEEGQMAEIAFLKSEYKYYSNGDVKEVHTYLMDFQTQELTKSTVRVYEQYDDKVNPLSQLGEISILFFGGVSGRNPLVEKEFDAQGNLEETVTNEFTYDALGYPTVCKVTTTEAGSPAEVKNVKFFYN